MPTVFTAVLKCYPLIIGSRWRISLQKSWITDGFTESLPFDKQSVNPLFNPVFQAKPVWFILQPFMYSSWRQRAQEKVIIPSQRQQLPNLSSASFSLYSCPSVFSPHLHNPREMDLFSSHPQRLPASAIVATTFVFNCRSKDVIVIVPGDSGHYHCLLPINATTCLSWSFTVHPSSYYRWSFGLQQSVSVLVIWLVCGFVNLIPVEIIKSDK